MEKIINNNTYRIKKMNAIELLAFKSQIDFDSYEKVIRLTNIILEHIEVKCKDVWLPVKQKEVYLPVGIEEDVETIEELQKFFLEYLGSVFHLSNASTQEQE